VTTVNRLRELIRAGVPARGLSITLGDDQIAEEFAHSGVDYVYVDQQHGLVDAHRLVAVLRALAVTDVTPLVRVPAVESGIIGVALDAGAHGVIVPMVEDARQAELAVRCTRYHPMGRRSWGPIRATHGLGTDPTTVNSEVMCLVMIESAEGVEHADEILAVDGVDGAYLGPADLSVSLGFPPRSVEEATDAEPLEAIARVREACARHGKVAAVSGRFETRSVEGFGMVTIGSDIGLLRGGLNALTRDTRTAGRQSERTAR
jgi:4-hydroxy-2-oxoheptanedioate aldolase